MSQLTAGEEKDTLYELFSLHAKALPFDLADLEKDRAVTYLRMLQKWSEAYNLTAVRGDVELVKRHWLDSLTIAPYISGTDIIDVGTGAGQPGIPLATRFADKNFCLLDSNTKRQIFLEQVVHKLELENVSLHCGRVETFKTGKLFDCIVSRAFRSLPESLNLTRHLLRPGGTILAMKAMIDDVELDQIDKDFRVDDVIPLATIEAEKNRHLVVVKLK